MANAEQYVQQANQLFNTVYMDTPDGSIPQRVLSRANAGKFAGLQAAANLSMGYAQNANNIINDHFTIMQNSVNSQISAYQSIMNEAGVNVRQGLSSDTSILNNQIAVLSDINSRIETKKQTILDFMSTAAAKFGEPIDLENDSEEVISQKIAMANLKYGVYSTYAQQYPDTLQYMDPSMTLDEIQSAINMSQTYKDSLVDGGKATTIIDEDIATTNNIIEPIYNVDFVGDYKIDKEKLIEALGKLETDYKNNNIQQSDYLIQKNALWDKFYLINEDYQNISDEGTNQIAFDVESSVSDIIKHNERVDKGRKYLQRNISENYITTVMQKDNITRTQAQIKLLRQQAYSDKEIYNILGEISAADLGFNNVGGDTNSALPENVAQAEIGSKGGQCGRFVNANTGLGLGNSYKSKMAKMNPNITEPKAGMVFVMPYKDTGHTGFIVSVDGDKVTVKDSNWSLDEKVKTHVIDKSKITGLTIV